MTGYGTTSLNVSGGTFEIMAIVLDTLFQDPPSRVEVSINGQATGILLQGEMGAANLGVYSYPISTFAGPLASGRYQLELGAETGWGRASDLWPYLTVE